jgi:hypothetical protein
MNISCCRAHCIGAPLVHRPGTNWRFPFGVVKDSSNHFALPPGSGGVVEWLMAPVLKTGRAQALVGSNPTPSARLTFVYLGNASLLTLDRAAEMRTCGSTARAKRFNTGASQPRGANAQSIGNPTSSARLTFVYLGNASVLTLDRAAEMRTCGSTARAKRFNTGASQPRGANAQSIGNPTPSANVLRLYISVTPRRSRVTGQRK